MKHELTNKMESEIIADTNTSRNVGCIGALTCPFHKLFSRKMYMKYCVNVMELNSLLCYGHGMDLTTHICVVI